MPLMPPLPMKRVNPSPPFTYTGLDYLGPLYIKAQAGVSKVWVCLFTCLVVRAIHLELVYDLSAKHFLMCLRRFTARRGVPKEIICDNAPQFKLTKTVMDKAWKNMILNEDVKNHMTNEGIQWSFIVEYSPWMGGFYERLVGLVKRSLRKVLRRKCVSLEQLQTLLTEIEAIINSRPLTYVDGDFNSGRALTPSNFLSLNPTVGMPQFETENLQDPDYLPKLSSAENLLQTWRKGMNLLTQFWKVWKNDYLKSLRERTQTQLHQSRLKADLEPCIGDIVLIHDQTPHGSWKIGMVNKLISSHDGQIRAAVVKLPSRKMLTRPLKLLYPIECFDKDDSKNDKPTVTDQGHINQNKTLPVPRTPPKRQAALRAKTQLQILKLTDMM